MGTLQRLVGSNVRRLRLARGLTQTRLAEALGRSTDLVSRIERGEAAPSFETLEKLCAELGVAPAILFGGAESGAARPLGEAALRLVDQLDEAEIGWLLDLLGRIERRPRR